MHIAQPKGSLVLNKAENMNYFVKAFEDFIQLQEQCVEKWQNLKKKNQSKGLHSNPKSKLCEKELELRDHTMEGGHCSD